MAVVGNDIYVTGPITPAATGTATFGNVVLTGTGYSFIAKITDAGSSGAWQWAQRIGGNTATAIVANGTNIYVAGVFSGTTTDFSAIPLVSMGLGDIFVAKYVDSVTALYSDGSKELVVGVTTNHSHWQ